MKRSLARGLGYVRPRFQLCLTRSFSVPGGPPVDYFKVLDVPRGATSEEIKHAFYRQAKLTHPDVNKHSSDNRGGGGGKEVAREKREGGTRDQQGKRLTSKENFQRLTEAYTVVGDEQRRLEHIDVLEGWESRSEQGDGDDMWDVTSGGEGEGFEAWSGDTSTRRQRPPWQRAEDYANNPYRRRQDYSRTRWEKREEGGRTTWHRKTYFEEEDADGRRRGAGGAGGTGRDEPLSWADGPSFEEALRTAMEGPVFDPDVERRLYPLDLECEERRDRTCHHHVMELTQGRHLLGYVKVGKVPMSDKKLVVDRLAGLTRAELERLCTELKQDDEDGVGSNGATAAATAGPGGGASSEAAAKGAEFKDARVGAEAEEDDASILQRVRAYVKGMGHHPTPTDEEEQQGDGQQQQGMDKEAELEGLSRQGGLLHGMQLELWWLGQLRAVARVLPRDTGSADLGEGIAIWGERDLETAREKGNFQTPEEMVTAGRELCTMYGFHATRAPHICTVFSKDMTYTHKVLNWYDPFRIRNAKWFTAEGIFMARATRGRLPDSRLWIFEKRSETHDVGGWMLEQRKLPLPPPKKGRPDHLVPDPACIILSLAFQTVLREALEDVERRAAEKRGGLMLRMKGMGALSETLSRQKESFFDWIGSHDKYQPPTPTETKGSSRWQS